MESHATTETARAGAGADHGDDAAITHALRRSEPWALEELHRRYAPLMLQIARQYVGSGGQAEDVLQETWLGVVGSIGRFEGRCSLKTWIMRILRNRALTERGRQRRTVVFSALGQDGEWADETPAHDWPPLSTQRRSDLPEALVIARETSAQIHHAIAQLPPAQCAVIMLRDVAGWEATDVCAALRLSPANQRVLLHRARQRLRHALGGDRGMA